VTPALLRSWPLPVPDGDGDKAERGRLLVIAGSREIPGAAILAAHAALRAGVGKLCIATDRSVAPGIAVSVPEARVVAVERDTLSAETDRFDALLVGPGVDKPGSAMRTCMAALAKRISPVVVDAGALELFSRRLRGARGTEARSIATPHMGEMAHLMRLPKEYVEAHAAQIAVEFAVAHGAVVALKGACTFIAEPGGALWVHDRSNVGLAVSGSGDVLAGIIGALAARGASCAQAAVWGVALHAYAGRRLVSQHGPLGGLARELPAFIPSALRELGSR